MTEIVKSHSRKEAYSCFIVTFQEILRSVLKLRCCDVDIYSVNHLESDN